MKKKFFFKLPLNRYGIASGSCQIQDPVQFKTELKTISDTEAQIVFTGKIDADGTFIPRTFLREVLSPLLST